MGNGSLSDTSIEEGRRKSIVACCERKRSNVSSSKKCAALPRQAGSRPIQRTATASGPSVHVAADTIEEAQHRRRAYAQEARRQAEESEAAERALLWHHVNLNPDATHTELESVHITYSKNHGTMRIPAGQDADIEASWQGGGSFTVVVTVAAANFTTTTEMSVQTSGSLDNKEIRALSLNTAGQTVHPEGKRAAVQFPVDEERKMHTLKLHAENLSRFAVELGLEVNGVRPAPARLPVERPFAV